MRGAREAMWWHCNRRATKNRGRTSLPDWNSTPHGAGLPFRKGQALLRGERHRSSVTMARIAPSSLPGLLAKSPGLMSRYVGNTTEFLDIEHSKSEAAAHPRPPAPAKADDLVPQRREIRIPCFQTAARKMPAY